MTNLNLKQMLDEYERGLIREALERAGGNQRRAAAALDLLPTTLHEKMKRLGIPTRAERDREAVEQSAEPLEETAGP
jgi:two-component system C4-dicarboxylate transport response regulator DctD